MHSYEHVSLNMILFNDRFEHVCLEKLCLITCLLGSFYACVTALIYCSHVDALNDVIWCDEKYAR